MRSIRGSSRNFSKKFKSPTIDAKIPNYDVDADGSGNEVRPNNDPPNFRTPQILKQRFPP
jgi:hypothetical protein